MHCKEGIKSNVVIFTSIVYLFEKISCLCFFLCVLQVVSEKAYASWLEDRQRALAAIDNREELLMETAVELETNLSLLGNTHQPSVHHSQHSENMHHVYV